MAQKVTEKSVFYHNPPEAEQSFLSSKKSPVAVAVTLRVGDESCDTFYPFN